MREDGKKVSPTFKDEVASGIGGSEAKLQHVKHQEFDQLTPSDQSDGIGGTSVALKPRSTKRRARRTSRDPARLDEGARHPKWKRPNALKSGVYSRAPLIPGEDPREFNKLYDDLIKEWKPSGPTLRFALRGLADWMWRWNARKNVPKHTSVYPSSNLRALHLMKSGVSPRLLVTFAPNQKRVLNNGRAAVCVPIESVT